MPYRYPPEFRRRVLDSIASGRSVASIAADLGVSDQTIYTWRKQELIDTGTHQPPETRTGSCCRFGCRSHRSTVDTSQPVKRG